MAEQLDPKEFVTIEGLAISNMREIAPLHSSPPAPLPFLALASDGGKGIMVSS